MLLLMCYNYDQYNIILIISFVVAIHPLVAKHIVHYIRYWVYKLLTMHALTEITESDLSLLDPLGGSNLFYLHKRVKTLMCSFLTRKEGF